MNSNNIKPEHQELMKEIGSRIKRIRTDKKIGYVQMAKDVGLSRNAYNAIELGNVYWNFSSLLRIADYHELPLSILFKGL